MFKKSIKSFMLLLFLGILISILYLSNTPGYVSGTQDSPIVHNLKPNAPTLEINRIYEINDDSIGSSEGDADNIVDAGETIELRLEIKNTGDQGVTGVAGNISSTNPFVDIQTSLQT
ncbi:MAG TPA: hypothetical protein VMX17_16175, partial [Candidatus Glassbacteria bacterium]|nr:hypothetical protein [Candidatus Glassbacteria bacterium]